MSMNKATPTVLSKKDYLVPLNIAAFSIIFYWLKQKGLNILTHLTYIDNG